MTRARAGVVLAAGFGTRLRPLTALRPKALCPVGGVPLVDLALARLTAELPSDPDHDPRTHLAVNAHHHAGLVAAHIGTRAHLSIEPDPLGTAGAVGRLLPWIDGRDVLLTNADSYLPDGLGALTARDGANPWDGERVRLLVTRAPGTPGDFVLDGDPVRYIGACLLPWHAIAGLRAEPSGLYEVLWRELDRQGLLDLVVTDARAIDCGTPADYLAANLHASGGRSVVGAGAVVNGTLERCVVWDGATVRAGEHLREVIRAGTDERPVTVRASVSA